MKLILVACFAALCIAAVFAQDSTEQPATGVAASGGDTAISGTTDSPTPVVAGTNSDNQKPTKSNKGNDKSAGKAKKTGDKAKKKSNTNKKSKTNKKSRTNKKSKANKKA